LLKKNPWPKQTGVLEHCREGETNSFSPFFMAFPSGRILKSTKDAICSSNFRKLCQRIPGTFRSN
jgi:hypothetical protein